MERLFATLGALLAGLAVGAGAFGAHALKARLSAADLAIFETAVRYQMAHALGLFAVAWVVGRVPGPLPVAAGWCLVGGVAVFSGSLYALVLTGQRWLGAITPIGGTAFLVGWALVAVAAWRLGRG